MVDRSTLTPRLTSAEIRLPGGMYDVIQSHMLGDTDREQFGIILGGYTREDHAIRLLGREYVIPTSNDLDFAHYTGVCLSQRFNRQLMEHSLKNGLLCMVHVHSHPFSAKQVAFSGIDDHYEHEQAGAIKSG